MARWRYVRFVDAKLGPTPIGAALAVVVAIVAVVVAIVHDDRDTRGASEHANAVESTSIRGKNLKQIFP